MGLPEMINLAAEIAEQLLVAKDNESEGLSPQTKLNIIRLAELASTMPDLPEAEPVAAEPLPASVSIEPVPYAVEPVVIEPEPRREPESPTGLVAAQLRRMFSLNDLFLFRRELFQGSRVLFDRALEDVGTCSSSAEARAILVNNYAFNPKRPEAKAFLEIISGLFEI